jgi:hypothetical protein
VEIEIEYEGKKRNLQVDVVKWGYTYRLIVTVNDVPVVFEPDEEGAYRAIIEDKDAEVDPALVEAVVKELGRME